MHKIFNRSKVLNCTRMRDCIKMRDRIKMLNRTRMLDRTRMFDRIRCLVAYFFGFTRCGGPLSFFLFHVLTLGGVTAWVYDHITPNLFTYSLESPAPLDLLSA